MDVKMVMFKRDGQRKEFPLQQKNTVIGRGEDCALRIPLLSVSRRHCELIQGEGELRLRDLASSNGTFVNNRRINEAVLRAGDRLVIGPVVFTVQIDGMPREIAPVKTKAQKAAEAALSPSKGAAVSEDEIVELEPDVAATGEDVDPIAALEAMADQTRRQPQGPLTGDKNKGKKK